MTFGITDQGFNPKRIEDIRTEINDVLRTVFGKGIDLDETDPFGQIRDIFAEREALLWEQQELIIGILNPANADGVNLDNVVSITGTVRDPATKSTVVLTLFGVVGTVIPAGSIVSADGDSSARFVTLVAATIAAGVDEVQRFTFDAVPDGGSFTINFDGEVTTAIDWNASAATIEAALEALANVEDVAVAGDPQTQPIDVTFQNDDGQKPQPLMLIASNSLSSTQIGTLLAVADVSDSLDRVYFIIPDSPTTTVAFWIDVDDSGSTVPGGALVADRQVEITTIITDDDANTVATKVAAAINADAAFVAPAPAGDTLAWTAATSGDRDASEIDNGDSGFTITETNPGHDPGGSW